MSEQPVPSALISSALLGNRLPMGSVALVAYEYVITFEQEVRFIWSQRKTGASLLFFVIRYYALVTLVFIQAISYMPMSSPMCLSFVKAQTAIQYAQYFGWAVFAGMRALAVSNMNWTLASIVFVLACGPFAVNMWNISTLGVVGYTIPVAGCIGGSQGTVFDAKIGVGLSRSCAIASDLLIIAITWWNAIRNGSLDAMRHDGPKMSLTRVMVLNGTTYFLALVLLNTLHLTLTLLSIVGLTEPVSEVTIFTDPLTAVIICRFLLALHAANHKTTDMGSNTSWLGTLSEVNLGTFNFASSAVHSMESVVASEPTEGALVDDIRLDVRRPRHTGWASDLSLGAV